MTLWNSMKVAPRDGTLIDVYFPADKQNVLSRTMWLAKEGRWNGMAKGEEPDGWVPLPEVPPYEAA